MLDKNNINQAHKEIAESLKMFETSEQLEILARYFLAKFHIGNLQGFFKKIYLSLDGKEKKDTTKILIDFI